MVNIANTLDTFIFKCVECKTVDLLDEILCANTRCLDCYDCLSCGAEYQLWQCLNTVEFYCITRDEIVAMREIFKW